MWPSQGHGVYRADGNPRPRPLDSGSKPAPYHDAGAGMTRDRRHFHPLMWPCEGHIDSERAHPSLSFRAREAQPRNLKRSHLRAPPPSRHSRAGGNPPHTGSAGVPPASSCAVSRKVVPVSEDAVYMRRQAAACPAQMPGGVAVARQPLELKSQGRSLAGQPAPTRTHVQY